MSGEIRVLLPAELAHLANDVLQAGCVPVIDATTGDVPDVPERAWVRTRPGRPAPGSGPVILAELGAPVPDRPTWVETSVARAVPKGFAGLVLKGREAGGLSGTEDGIQALANCPDPSRVLLDAGLGPRGVGAAAALGAAGVVLTDTWLGCPEVTLPPALAARLSVPGDEATRVVAGLRVANAATAPVLAALVGGGDPWQLSTGVWSDGDLQNRLWMLGQGLALAKGLADRYGTLGELLGAYVAHWRGWSDAARQAVAVDEVIPVHTPDALAEPGTAAGTGGVVGSAVLWEMAGWLGRPIHGGPTLAAAATGCAVVAEQGVLADALRQLPAVEAPSASPATGNGSGAVATPEAVPAVAIIGIGCRFPGANGTAEFWDNIVSGRSAIASVPEDRWDVGLYFDEDPAVADKSYTTVGAFLTDFQFEPKRFRIPPKMAKQIDPVQQITLTCVADALDDAGLKVDRRHDGREFNRERCAVILGNSLGGEVSDAYAIRLNWHAVRDQLQSNPAVVNLPEDQRKQLLADAETAYLEGLPVINEDSMPGELANVIAGRIANAFDLGGANYTVDAACASSMAAIQNAVKTLQDGESDLVITGGADRSMNIATYVKFCKIGALSPSHSAPFDSSANGFVMGEGCGILVLKRYEDAVADGDRIYSVIRGVGASSDGKGKGITAPNIQGQIRALNRAYEAAGFTPQEVDLIECHGTSTVVGDKVEVEALTTVIGPRGDRGPVRIGSVKSMIGHLKSAAGAASCIKAALSLHHGVLPPSLGFENAREDVPLDVVPLKVQTHAEPWPENASGLRRCGISAFGFGGTNFHIVMESFGGQALPRSTAQLPPAPQVVHPASAPAPAVATTAPASAPAPAMPTVAPEAPVAFEAPRHPEGIWATSGVDRAELLENLKRLAAGEPAPWNPSAPVRIAAAARDDEERESQLGRAIKAIDKGTNPDMLRARAIHLEEQPFDGKVSLLFTGQGSQYLDMGLDLAAAYPVVAETFAEADRILTPDLGKPITEFIRLAEGEDKGEKSDVLRQTEYSQPATLTLDIAILRLLTAYGVSPDMVAGHSLGEYGAAVAAGVMTFPQALYAVSARGREMANIRLDDPGKMAGIAASTDVVESVLAEVDGYVIAANKNCPTQTVIAGASDAVEEASERFKARGMTVYPLPVSHAFHSSIVAPASEPLRGVLTKLGLQAPKRPITTNVTGEYYPTGPKAVDEIIDLLAQQISAPVEWVAQMERMYADGARVFVEVGPKRALSGFTVSILKRRPHRALYTNHPKRGGVASFRDSLAGLMAFGFPIRPEPLAGEIDLFAPPSPRLATSEAVELFAQSQRPDQAHSEALPDIRDGVLSIVAELTGYEIEELDLDYELEADLGIDTVKQAEVFSTVRSTWNLPEDGDFDMSANRTLGAVVDWVAQQLGGRRTVVDSPAPAAAHAPVATAAPVPVQPAATGPALVSDDVVTRFLADAAQAGGDGSLDNEAFARALLPAIQGLLSATLAAADSARVAPEPSAPVVTKAPAPVATPAPVVAPAPSVVLPGSIRPAEPTVRVVCAGASVGLPGGDEVFSPSNFAEILSGQNRISHIGDRAKAFLEKGLVRLVKDSQTGQGTFLPVEDEEQVIRLAGIKARFDVGDYGVPENFARALDVTTEMSFAAGIEALRDAGVPLVRVYKTTSTGKKVPQGWQLPEGLRDSTGIIFASAFPGYDQLLQKVAVNGDDGEGHFDRRFLFQVLAMGHSQFAQFVGARGPNTAVNAACASTTQAVAIAEDWIRVGRCERVIVVGCDDVTSESLLPWIGSGFMAAGAATTADRVEDAALPFDRRRHGMILGMGAVGLVLERADVCEARGVAPVAELSGSLIVNSAFHGTRLDIDHIQNSVRGFVEQVAEREGTTPGAMAQSAFFVSHETYTPARGGSSAAEIAALRSAFGDDADRIVITNTKGFTGHAMGAGIEDAVAVKALQYGWIPPVANLQEPDPDLGPLTLSKGERRDSEWCVRLAAGFGSQLAVAVWKRGASGDDRVLDEARRAAWLHRVTGFSAVEERVEQRTLRVFEAQKDQLLPLIPEVSPAQSEAFKAIEPEAAPTPTPAPVEPPAVAVESAPQAEVIPLESPKAAVAMDSDAVLKELVEVIAEKTGYEPDELETDFELEADLGIDTVKQAEILSELTDKYGLQRDEDFSMADYPTIEALAAYLTEAMGQAGGAPAAPAASPAEEASETPEATEPVEPAAEQADAPAAEVAAPVEVTADDAAPVAVEAGASLADLVEVVAEKTGYEPDELEPDFELEADLGVDTVKQAEIISALQERYALPPDDDFNIADYPTLESLAGYLDARRGQVGGGAVAPAAQTLDPSGEPLSMGADVIPESDPAESDPTNVALPDSFRVRRPFLLDQPCEANPSLQGRVVHVLGTGEVANAVQAEAVLRGAEIQGDADVVIDVSDALMEAFHHAKRVDGKRPTVWLTLTRLGDLDGIYPLDRAHLDGSRAGFTKSLGREWDETLSKVVDIPSAMGPADVARALCDEIQTDSASEVFLRDGQRRVVGYRIEDPPERGALAEGSVVLVTGGGRGICAQIARVIAERSNVKLALVGRGPAGETPLDEKAEKARIKAEIKESGERATPARIEAQLGPMRKADEVRETLETLRGFGREAEYFQCDLGQDDSIRALLEAVEAKLGPVDVCIHGAGVEHSRLIADKDDAAFQRVYNGKALGGQTLVSLLGPEVLFVSMGSVAGRFGNPGQVDYAAANDALARVCLTRPNSLHIDWTAWDDVGMAVTGGMKHLLEQRGVDLLPADAGSALLVNLMSAGVCGELVVAGGLGDFLPKPAHPLLDRVEMEGDVVRAFHTLTLETDPWIVDHSIDGTPVLPGVIGLEMMGATASLVRPQMGIQGAKNVRFNAPIKVHGDRTTELIIEAQPTAREGEVHARLLSERTLRTGRVSRTEHFSATLIFDRIALPDSLASAFLPDEQIGAEAIYARFFHGPRFQVLKQVLGLSEDGLICEASVDHAGIASGLITMPLVLESAFQAAGLHRMVVAHQMGLPMQIDELVLIAPPEEASTFSLTCQRVGDEYDIDLDGVSGPIMRVRGFALIDRGPLPEGDRFPAPEEGRPVCFPQIKTTFMTGGGDDRAEGLADGADQAEEWLTQEELVELRARGTAKRVADRIAGRVAAKKALQALTGTPALQLRIRSLPSGEPVVDGADVSVSISHRDGHAVAVAVRGGRVGVDLEGVERRPTHFAETWFTEQERVLAAGDPLRETVLWSIKEAVLKVLGTGMALSPHEVRVERLGASDAQVVLSTKARIRLGQVGGGELQIRWAEHGPQEVLVEATLGLSVA